MRKLTTKEFIQKTRLIHAENIGEYKITGTRYKADGFCKETNTIYEFYGDIWHGNLNLFNKSEMCHPFNNKTADELFNKTLNREQEIKKLGFNIVTIWENQWPH